MKKGKKNFDIFNLQNTSILSVYGTERKGVNSFHKALRKHLQ